jgi:type IV pilus assembly protein PilX
MTSHRLRRVPLRCTTRQRGVVLLFSLVRSFQSSLFTAGNIAFKRDMQNQSERAADSVLTAFRTGGLNTVALRSTSDTSKNYSATMLPSSNLQGVPDALQSDTTFATVGVTSNDIVVAGQAVTVRYVIDRLCAATGDETTLGSGTCTLADNPAPAGTSSSNLEGADRGPLCATCSSAAPQGVVYRLSVKVTGPRNTQSFFQSTFNVPS